MSTTSKGRWRDDRLDPLADLTRKALAGGGELEDVVRLIRRSSRRSMTWKDVDVSLAVAKRYFDGADDESTYVWTTLALAALSLMESDARGIIGRAQRILLRGSGHAKRLEAYAYLARGAAATELGRYELARSDLEKAKAAYAASETGATQTMRVNLRQAHLELSSQNWQQAELIAESALRLMGSSATAADRSECIVLIGNAQLGMHRFQAALDSAEQVLEMSGHAAAVRAPAYLLKAAIELESGRRDDAARDCAAAGELFAEVGDVRGTRRCKDLELRIINRGI